MPELTTPFIWEKHRKILTPAETGIPALRLFGIYTGQQTLTSLEEHYHRDCIEIVFLLKGFQIYEVGREHFNLSGSNLFVAYPNEVHSSGSYPQSVCEMIWLQINLTDGLPFFGLDSASADLLRNAIRALPRLFSGTQELQSSLLSAFYDLASRDPLTRMSGRHQLIYALIRMVQCSRYVSDRPIAAIDRSISYIHGHLEQPIALEVLADLCGFSLSRFKVKFKEGTGTTPRDYINRVKIEHSKALLRAGLSVADTASRLSFNTPNYFSVLFRKYSGESPSDYRNRTHGSQSDAKISSL